MTRSWPLVLVAVAALCGFLFAAVATYDFAQHLDRQVHAIHCSFVPGLAAVDATGSSGCQVTMMSPYSSVLRSMVWGGVPIALGALGVFAFLFFFALELLLAQRERDRKATAFLFVATMLPTLTSIVMGYVSIVALDAACKLCIGIYAASGVALVGALLAFRRASQRNVFRELAHDPEGAEEAWSMGGDDKIAPFNALPAETTPAEVAAPMVSGGYLAAAFGVGVLFVALPLAAYVARAPSHDAVIANCGTLERPKDIYKVLVPLGGALSGVPTIEVLDPLCPSCRAFEERFLESGLSERFARQGLLFPLDDSCNWMVDTAVHPGACAVSEALLCAKDGAREVLEWAFDHQEEIRTAAAKDRAAATQMVLLRFPSLRGCMGSAGVRTKLNKSLRFAVRNRLQILTPQLFVAGVKLCDEDVDLGLDYALSHLLEMHEAGTLPVPKEKPEPPQFEEIEPDLEVNKPAAQEAPEALPQPAEPQPAELPAEQAHEAVIKEAPKLEDAPPLAEPSPPVAPSPEGSHE